MKNGILLSPNPKEYEKYTDRKKIIKTEELFERVERIKDNINQNKEVYRKRIDILLAKGTKAEEVAVILQEKMGYQLCNHESEFHAFKILCQIAEYEEKFKEPCVLQNFHNMEEAGNWLQQCVFELRRFEFGWEDGTEFLTLLQERKLSYICLADILCKCEIIRKYETAGRLACYLCGNGWKREAILLLIWVEQMLSYSDEKIMSFTMTLLEMGERKLAYEMLMKYRNPDVYVKEMQAALAKKL